MGIKGLNINICLQTKMVLWRSHTNFENCIGKEYLYDINRWVYEWWTWGYKD